MAAICFLFCLSFSPQERFNFHQQFHEKILLFNNNKLGKFLFWDSNIWAENEPKKFSLSRVTCKYFCSEVFEEYMNSSSSDEGFGKFTNYQNVVILSRQISNMDFDDRRQTGEMNADGKLQTGLDNMKIQLGKTAKQMPFHEHSLLPHLLYTSKALHLLYPRPTRINTLELTFCKFAAISNVH